jgi:cytochrome P450
MTVLCKKLGEKMDMAEFQPIPIQKGWPLLGILPKLIGRDPYEYLINTMLEQGDFVQLNFGPQPVYLVSHPDYLQHILRDNYPNYRKSEVFYNAGREVAGNGLVTSSGDLWLRQRRMIQPHLHRKQLEHLFTDMREAIVETLDGWELLATNHTEVDLREKMGEITMNIITRTMFGKGTLPAEEVAETGRRAARLIQYIGGTLFSSLLPKWFPVPGRREFLRDLAEVRESVDQIIVRCRQDKEISAGLIQMLLNSVDEESHQQMTEQQLFDEVMTIFIAGYETTATALTWLGILLQEHPEVLEKLRAEVDQVLGTRVPSFEDVPRLVYARQVFMETLRMHTVSPFVPRSSNETDRLGSHYLPANALILVFYHGVHHNPRVWDNPEVFDPERFIPERMAGLHPFAYVPFSAGPRKCAGDEFAMMEGPLVMAMILQRYNIHVLPNQSFAAGIGATRYPQKGVKATFSVRAETKDT